MILLRAATVDDASAVAEVYLRARHELVAHAPLAHTDDEVRSWTRETLIPSGDVVVAVADGEVVGMLAVARRPGAGWIDHLYVAPERTGHGIGTRLLDEAKSRLGAPIRAYTFQESARARAFYERHGFGAIAYGDGSTNEEGRPDVLYEWLGA